MATPRILDRRGRVVALDRKNTGDEPEWKDGTDISCEDYYLRRAKCFRFYTYYLGSKDMKPWILKWMEKNSYSVKDIATVKRSPTWYPLSTIGKLVRMLDLGMPDMHPDAEEYYKATYSDLKDIQGKPLGPTLASDLIKMELKDIIRDINATIPIPEKVVKVEAKKVSPARKLEDRVNDEVIKYLDGLLDSIAVMDPKTSPAKIPTIDITRHLTQYKIPTAGASHVIEWLSKNLEEFNSAYDESDEQMVEGYEYLRKPQLRRIVENFTKMLEDAKKYWGKKEKGKKTRKKRVRTADTQIKRLKYLVKCDDYKLESVDPLKLPFAQRVYFFNTKNRQLSIYFASGHAGLSIKGTTLQDFDKESSVIMTLRKPEEVLGVLTTGLKGKIDKMIAGLKTKPRKANGRVNANMIILSTLDVK